MDRLSKEARKISGILDKMKKENSAEEENNRNLWSRRDQNLRLNVQMYDQEITQNEETVNKMQMDLDDTNVDLN